MFGKELYPTPPELAEKMLEPYIKDIHKCNPILEPSAGSGRLIEACVELMKRKVIKRNEERKEMYEKKGTTDWREMYFENEEKESEKIKEVFHVCEIDPDLQDMLRGKGLKVVGDNFMDYQTFMKYDLIIMNPPFSDGVHHVLKAWEMLAPGGKLCALLSAHTLMNNQDQPYVVLRNIIKGNGSAINAGRAFEDAERPTGVQVAIIRLKRKKEDSFNLFDDPELEKVSFEKLEGEPLAANTEIATRDIIGNLLKQYELAAEYYIKWRQALRTMEHLKQNFDFYGEDEKKVTGGNDFDQYNNYLQKLNMAAWRTVFRLTGMKRRMTEKMRAQFEKHEKDTAVMAFTRKNINHALMMLVDNSSRIMTQCVLDCYDELTRYSDVNKETMETWKTNNAFRVKRKVIIPYCVEYSSSWGFSINYRVKDGIIADLDKAMCFIAGRKIEDITTISDAVEISKKKAKTQKGMIETMCTSTFFELRFFKKGTLHIKFEQEDLWNRFNQIVAKERGWLPDYEEAGENEIVVSNKNQ